MNIFVQQIKDPTDVYVIELSPSETVLSLKLKIVNIEPLITDVKLLKLFFNEQELKEDKALITDFNITRNAYLKSFFKTRSLSWEDNEKEIKQSIGLLTADEIKTCLPLNAINLRRLFLFFIQRVFSTPTNYGNYRGYLHDKIWSSNPDLRLISVQLAHDFDATQIYNMLPSIFVSVSDHTFEDDGIVRSSAGFNNDNSAEVFTLHAKTNIGICCYADTYDFACALGEIVLMHLLAYRTWIVQNYGLRYFNLKQMSQPKLIKAQDDAQISYYRVDIFSEATYNHAMQFITESLRLKKVDNVPAVEAGNLINLNSIS